MSGTVQKARTRTECEAALKHSAALERPLGIPTATFMPEDYRRTETFIGMLFLPSLRKSVYAKLRHTFNNAGLSTTGNVGVSSNAYHLQMLAETVINGIETSLENYWNCYVAHAMPKIVPGMSAVVFHPHTDPIRQELSMGTRIDKRKIALLPGLASQHNFFTLWHEYGHGRVGLNEPAADLIGAYACRNTFEDCTFLQVQADVRAVDTVLNYYKWDEVVNKYGWPCVTAIDTAAATTNVPDWNEMEMLAKAAEFAVNDHETVDVTGAGKIIQRLTKKDFNVPNLAILADATDTLLKDNAFNYVREREIAERFALAARRLSVGCSAYKKTEATATSATGLYALSP